MPQNGSFEKVRFFFEKYGIFGFGKNASRKMTEPPTPIVSILPKVRKIFSE
jgi:hypothetical protein